MCNCISKTLHKFYCCLSTSGKTGTSLEVPWVIILFSGSNRRDAPKNNSYFFSLIEKSFRWKNKNMKYDCCKERIFTKPFSVVSCLKLIRDQKSLKIRKEIGSLREEEREGALHSFCSFGRKEWPKLIQEEEKMKRRRTETKERPQTKQKPLRFHPKRKVQWQRNRVSRKEKGVKGTSVDFKEKWEKRSKNSVSKYDELRCVRGVSIIRTKIKYKSRKMSKRHPFSLCFSKMKVQKEGNDNRNRKRKEGKLIFLQNWSSMIKWKWELKKSWMKEKTKERKLLLAKGWR